MMFLSSNTAQPCEGCGLYQPRQLFELLGRQNGTTHAVARSVRIKATSVCPALFVTMFIQTHQIEDTRHLATATVFKVNKAERKNSLTNEFYVGSSSSESSGAFACKRPKRPLGLYLRCAIVCKRNESLHCVCWQPKRPCKARRER